MRTCASNFLPTCILILFNADVNWLPGTASPYSYSRQLVLYSYSSFNFVTFFEASMSTIKIVVVVVVNAKADL